MSSRREAPLVLRSHCGGACGGAARRRRAAALSPFLVPLKCKLRWLLRLCRYTAQRVDVVGVRCYSSTDLSKWQDEGGWAGHGQKRAALWEPAGLHAPCTSAGWLPGMPVGSLLLAHTKLAQFSWQIPADADCLPSHPCQAWCCGRVNTLTWTPRVCWSAQRWCTTSARSGSSCGCTLTSE